MRQAKLSVTWEERQRARRRLAAETGAIVKDWGGKLPWAFVYPNTYYIGMSNLGLQAVYGLINFREEALCERVFWDDENRLKGSLPLSVESQRPLSDFAVLAFSLNYEIDYFNIAPILRASGLPLYSAQRDATSPLVIAGGPCITANPMPLAPFFDCLCIGEAEELLPSMLPVLSAGIAGDREELLKELSKIPGVYVPRCSPGKPIVRRWLKDLDRFPAHSIVLARDTELNDLYLLEVERGCGHGCQFCLVSSAYKPLRLHSVEQLTQQARRGLAYRKRIGLVGPAVTDHPQIQDLLDRLLQMGAQFSISSLRINSLTPRLLEQMVQGGLHSIALAPEAGSEVLRQEIKKGITENQVLEVISSAAEKGIRQLKLYFMLGLPRETEADIQAIVDLTLACKSIIDRMRSPTRLSLNLAPFVPKAGTPFQRLPMAPLEVIRGRLSFLKGRLTPRGIQIRNESPQWSEVQAVLARGDAGLAEVLAEVEKASLPAWRQAIQKHGVDLDFYAHKEWKSGRKLPWSIIESGIS